MITILKILGEIEWAEGVWDSVGFEEALTTTIFAAGLIILVNWLVNYGGFSALRSAPVRVNKLRLHTPLLVLFIWVILFSISGLLIKRRFGDPLPIQGQLSLYVGLFSIDLAMIFGILVIGYMDFHGRFSGFGLDVKTLKKDIFWGTMNYLAVMPLVLLSIWAVSFFGEILIGPGFEIPKNESLELLNEIDIWFKVLVIFSAAIVVPVFEELLFRGLIQSSLRTHLRSPWLAIILTSLVFVVMHGIWQHWLPLMALSVCMGYSYEKSGSLFRPIFIHVIFNSVSVAVTLMAGS